MTTDWSAEIPLTTLAINKDVPTHPGVYEIIQSVEYARYKGKTRVVRIGVSKNNLRQDLLNYLTRHTSADRLDRILKQPKLTVSVRVVTILDGTAAQVEDQLLRDFEEEHWDVPVLNAPRAWNPGAGPLARMR